MASAPPREDDDGPPPAYPGTTVPTPVPVAATPHQDKDYVIVRIRFGSGGWTQDMATAKFFAEEQILNDIGPVLNKLFPRGNIKLNRQEHMLRCELGYSSIEYWQIQIFKMLSARGFTMRTSHASAIANDRKVVSATYIFGR